MPHHVARATRKLKLRYIRKPNLPAIPSSGTLGKSSKSRLSSKAARAVSGAIGSTSTWNVTIAPLASIPTTLRRPPARAQVVVAAPGGSMRRPSQLNDPKSPAAPVQHWRPRPLFPAMHPPIVGPRAQLSIPQLGSHSRVPPPRKEIQLRAAKAFVR